jgi:16S rRNA (guanine527-N7)-methyltransferase
VAASEQTSHWLARIERALAQLSASGVAKAEELGTRDTLEQLTRYLTLVHTWNARHDLTAARNEDELVDLFIADAAVLAVSEPSTGSSWVDVGSGAGAPGLPLAILRPDLNVTLVEPRTKRVAFLRTVIGTLGLAVDLRRARSEGLLAQSFDVAVARATLPPPEWAVEGMRLARTSVWMLLAQAEPPESPGCRTDLDVHYRWPLTGVERRAVRLVPVA